MYRMYKQMLDNELESYLKHSNYELGLTLKQIAEKLGCSRASVSRMFKKFNIEIKKNKDYFNPSKYGYDNKEQLKRDLINWHYKEKYSQSAIAEELGCRRATVIDLFKRLDIPAQHFNLLYQKCGFNNDREMAMTFSHMYHYQKLSKKQIAEKFKISVDPVTWVFQRYDIQSRNSSETLANMYEQNDILPTRQEMDIINGMLLGDGHIEVKRHTGMLCLTCKHEEVAKDAAMLLSRFGAKYYKKTYRSKGKERIGYRMNTLSFPFFKQLRSIWTSKEGRPADLDKSPPPDIQLPPETCYWWYVGDGSTMRGCIKFCTHGFSKTDVKMLASKLVVESTVWDSYNKKQDKKYPIITINKIEERRKFLRYIGPCRHQCYAYKWRVLNSKGANVGI